MALVVKAAIWRMTMTPSMNGSEPGGDVAAQVIASGASGR